MMADEVRKTARQIRESSGRGRLSIRDDPTQRTVEIVSSNAATLVDDGEYVDVIWCVDATTGERLKVPIGDVVSLVAV